ncbi:MAG: DUF433 domain-containing protein [Gammaproteobacteria bacterium]
MAKQYVEKLDDVYLLVGTSVSLDSVVHAFWRGQTVESIAQSFPVLTLEQIYGALTFYLAHQAEVDTYLVGHGGGRRGESRRVPSSLKRVVRCRVGKIRTLPPILGSGRCSKNHDDPFIRFIPVRFSGCSRCSVDVPPTTLSMTGFSMPSRSVGITSYLS